MVSAAQPSSAERARKTTRVDPGRWHRFIHWLCQKVYYSRVTLLHRERLPDPTDGPVLYVSTHRNGAMDGFILHGLFPGITFLIARNLRSSLFLRLFFPGIEVVRRKDEAASSAGRHEANRDALDRCESHLAANGQLLVFPEGTSTLGPHHLPFQGGAARILLRFLEENPGRPIAVVPLGLHYERAWAFRSRVEVVVGHPISTELEHWSTSRARLGLLKQRIREALEATGANFPSPEAQARCEASAYTATLGTNHSYAAALKRFEAHYPDRLLRQWRVLREDAAWPALWRHQGVPLVPTRMALLPVYACWFAVTAPCVALGALLNAPPLLAAFLAGRHGADDRNVIALWRVLVGAPATLAWLLLLGAVAVAANQPALLGAHLALSALGLLSFYRAKKLAVTIHNGLRFPRARCGARHFHRSVLDTLAHEDTNTSTLQPAGSAR